ncbi:MAG TPA: hypothetical protein VHM20_02645, partial [Gammaproteobacteria bacterium]|nr:hypothetical protein [Gammaproteobacteria bacterium]
MPTYDYLVEGVTCVNCTNTIENNLLKNHNLKAHSHIMSQVVSVTVEDDIANPPSKEEIAEWIDEVGFEATFLDRSTPDDNIPLPNNHLKILANKKKLIRQYWKKGILGILSGAAVMALCMFGMGLPIVVMYLIGVFSSLMTLYLGFESYKKFLYSFKTKKFNSMDLLFSISTSVTIILSLMAFAFPWLPMMFDAPILIYAFRHIGKAIQEKAKKTEFEQTSFRNHAPAFVKKIGEKNKVPLHSIKPDNIIIVMGGEIIPLDGICLTKEIILDTSIRDGESEHKVTKGEPLFAGMRVPKDIPLVKMQVTRTEKDSNLAAMEDSVKDDDSEEKKAKLQKIAEKILKYFVPVVVTLAVTFGVTLSFFFPIVAAVQCAIAILTSVCPCTFGLITPLAITMAKAKAAVNGFHFTSGNALQKARDVDTVFFD